MVEVVGVWRKADTLEVAVQVFELWTEQLIVAMVLLNQEKIVMMEMMMMVTDETAHEQLNQIMSEVGLRVHVLCFVETALSILVKHEMMEI